MNISNHRIGIQSYTLRNELRKDFKSTIVSLAEYGFREIELVEFSEGQFFGNSIEDIRDVLTDHDIKPISAHTFSGNVEVTGPGTLLNDFEYFLDSIAALETKYAGLIYLFPQERVKLDDYKRLADLVNISAEKARSYDIQFVYHHHDFEFEILDHEIPFDIILNRTDDDLVKIELDIYWLKKAGVQIHKLTERFPKRFPLWHLKDMEANEEGFFTEIGNGCVDWNEILSASDLAGLEHIFVEQDECRNYSPTESVKKSIENLKGILSKQ